MLPDCPDLRIRHFIILTDMKIGEKTFVALSYQLKVDGEVVETVTAESPLRFVYGTGFLLPAFEKQLEGLEPGGEFAFRLEPAEAYGDVVADAVVELPKEVFMIEGKIEDGLLEVGNQLPMSDNQGNRLVGVVKAVGENSVTMDFNHPMAGKALEFTGRVVEVREATPEDMMMGHHHGGGCDCCGDGCGDGCDHDHKGGCGCGC